MVSQRVGIRDIQPNPNLYIGQMQENAKSTLGSFEGCNQFDTTV